MTKTKQALAWIALGKPRKHMAKDLGIDPEACHRVINYLRAAGYIQPVPEVYELTQKGRVRQNYTPKTPAPVIARKVRQRRERVEKTKAKAFDSARMVANTIANQPTSVFQLGGM